MKLYEIADEIERILAREVDPETGEITDETLEKLAALEMDRDDMALHIAAYSKGERAEGKAIADAAQGMLERAQRHTNRADRLERYLDTYCEQGKKLEDERSEIVWRKSTAVVVTNVALLGEDMIRTKVTRDPDKKKIGELLKAGKRVDGAELERRVRLKVR